MDLGRGGWSFRGDRQGCFERTSGCRLRDHRLRDSEVQGLRGIGVEGMFKLSGFSQQQRSK